MTRKPKPDPMATSLRLFFSIMIRAEYCGNEYNNSDVIRRIKAITASHKPTSIGDKGKFIVGYSRTTWYQITIDIPSGEISCFRIVTGLPEDLAIAHATALARGQPRRLTLLKSFSLL